MTNTVVICLTCLVALAFLGWLYVHLQKLVWQREDARIDRGDKRTVRVTELTERLATALEKFETAHESTSVHMANNSERLAIFERALSAAIGQVVKVVDYSEAKAQQLQAKVLTGGARPLTGGR